MKSYGFIIKLILAVLTLGFIWCHSMLPGDLSSRESEWFLNLVQPIVAVIQRILSGAGLELDSSFLVRKLAHFTEYAVLGVLVYLLFLKPEGKGRFLLAAAACLVAAAVDETIQIFVNGRGPAVRDVGIDFAGACVGMLAAALAVFLLYRIRRQKNT